MLRRTITTKQCPRLQRLAPRALYVPSEGLGGVSPEKKAGQALKKLFTFCAASSDAHPTSCKTRCCFSRAIMAQLEGSGRGSLASYNVAGYSALRDSISTLSKTDCNEWLRQLAEKNKLIGTVPLPNPLQYLRLAMRVMEVRSAYCAEEFEWENCKKVTVSDLENDNLTLMRELLEHNTVFDES